MNASKDIISQEDLYHRLSAQQAPTGETNAVNHFLVAFYAHWMPLTRLKARLPTSSVAVVP
jgi:hypothetical protein